MIDNKHKVARVVLARKTSKVRERFSSVLCSGPLGSNKGKYYKGALALVQQLFVLLEAHF